MKITAYHADPGVGRPSGYGVVGHRSPGSALRRRAISASRLPGRSADQAGTAVLAAGWLGIGPGPGARDRGCAAKSPATGQAAG